MLNASVHHQESIPTRIENVIFLTITINNKKLLQMQGVVMKKIKIYEGLGEGLNEEGHFLWCWPCSVS